jgi:hypothetical protein
VDHERRPVRRPLPEDHPVFTAVSVAQERLSEEWRKEHGLDKFMGGDEQGQVPAGFRARSPAVHGEHFRAPTRFTPMSLFSDPGGTIAQQVNPQFNGILKALRGPGLEGRRRSRTPTARRSKTR